MKALDRIVAAATPALALVTSANFGIIHYVRAAQPGLKLGCL